MKYGFIGCGNMGGAIAKAMAAVTHDMILSDRSGKAAALADTLGCKYGPAIDAAGCCERLFLGVKPQMMAGVLENLRPVLLEKKPVLISMAAGLTMESLEKMVGAPLPMIRIMPNTPVGVGKGVVLYCANSLVSEELMADFLADMAPCGMLEAVDEKLFDAAGTVSGCSPAYLYMFIEAMADGGVACGVPRAKAMRFAAAAMAGAAEMVLQSGKHPGELKDAVCSPGGSTIAGVKVLEENGFRGVVMDCIIAAYKRNQELGKQ